MVRYRAGDSNCQSLRHLPGANDTSLYTREAFGMLRIIKSLVGAGSPRPRGYSGYRLSLRVRCAHPPPSSEGGFRQCNATSVGREMRPLRVLSELRCSIGGRQIAAPTISYGGAAKAPLVDQGELSKIQRFLTEGIRTTFPGNYSMHGGRETRPLRIAFGLVVGATCGRP